MTLERDVAELRDAVKTAYEATKFVVVKSQMLGPQRRERMLNVLEKTLEKAERVFDSILFEGNERKFQMAKTAVELTLKVWQEMQCSCVPDVGIA
jgi:hypothetical protein